MESVNTEKSVADAEQEPNTTQATCSNLTQHVPTYRKYFENNQIHSYEVSVFGTRSSIISWELFTLCDFSTIFINIMLDVFILFVLYVN